MGSTTFIQLIANPTQTLFEGLLLFLLTFAIVIFYFRGL